MTTVRQIPIKIGAKVVSNSRFVLFKMTEVVSGSGKDHEL